MFRKFLRHLRWALVDRHILKVAQDDSVAVNLNIGQWALRAESNPISYVMEIAEKDAAHWLDDIRTWRARFEPRGFMHCTSDAERRAFMQRHREGLRKLKD